MENKKIDRIIETVRYYIHLKEEGGMVANAAGSQGAFGPEANSRGPAAGWAPVIKFHKRRIFLGNGSRKRWKKPK